MTKMYSGKIEDIIARMCEEIGNALSAAGLEPNGLRMFAFMHLIAMAWRELRDDISAKGEAPSFATMLSIFTRTATHNTEWTDEEKRRYEQEFIKSLRSLGGHVLDQSQVGSDSTFVAPATDIVH